MNTSDTVSDAPHLAALLPDDPLPYINRELSWLDFNQRVLEEAQDERHPLLERVKFLAIFHANLDEFFMIRVSGLQVQRAAGVSERAIDGLTPTEALQKIAVRVDELMHDAHHCARILLSALQREHIEIRSFSDVSPEDRDYLHHYFETEIFPILTPLAVDSGHPFPHISNLSLNLAVLVRDPIIGDRFARMKIPGSLPRLVACPFPEASGITRFTYIDEVIAHYVGALFPGLDAIAAYPFRVTRNADIEIQEDEAEDLLRTVLEGVRERHFGFITRLEVTPAMPPAMRNRLVEDLEMDGRNVVVSDGPMGQSSLMELLKVDRPALKFPPLVPHVPHPLNHGGDFFEILSKQDVLLHHPFDSFTPVISFVEAAARDTHVRAIKQTLYRLGPHSPLVPALISARDGDTQVAVLVELKARFDEENNIEWARALDQAGVHVVYGLVGLKTHCKVLLVVRREPGGGGIKRYLHLGTGNYNATTARIYTDFSLMTTDEALGADATDLFNYLTGYSRQTTFRKMLVAPINLRQQIAKKIMREIDHALAGRPARLIFKMNALVDAPMIELLYKASQAGVQIDLIIRGICSLRPGLVGVSENIRVVSIVGRFLEHSRVYFFENNGENELYMGSADIMTRNLDRRVEVLFPLENAELRRHVLHDVLLVLLADTVQARQLLPDGTWVRIRPEGRKRGVDAQARILAGSGNGISGRRKKKPRTSLPVLATT